MAEKIKMPVDGEYIEYKGKPLVRNMNTICYGDMTDKYVLLLTIMSCDADNVPENVLVQVISTDGKKQIVKQDMKKSLFDAFDVGVIWLERML